MEEETIGLGFHSHRDAITGVASPTEAAASSFSIIDKQQHHATTRFVSSSDSKLVSRFPLHPPTVQQQQQPIIQSNDNDHSSLSLHSSQIQQPRPQEMHQNAFTNQPTMTFQPPPGLPPQLSIPPTMAVPPLSHLPPPSIPLQHQQIMQSQIIQQQQQQNDSIAKARAIAQRFHTESTQPPFLNNNNTSDINTHNYAQKRKQHFQTEKLKLQTATLKNLEYIMKHEESQLRSHVECMNEMTEWGERQEMQLQLMRRQQMQKREQQQQQQQQRQVEKRSGGGIGSKDQRYVERVRKRQQVEHLTTDGCSTTTSGNTAVVNQQQQQSPQQRTSIYLTNLPTDGSITERTLRSLFCVYGRLDRVTMYRNRSTGELKGDGLIVFGLDAIISSGGSEIRSGTNLHVVSNNTSGGSGNDLIETVCMQMNGAELPCGTVIGVEPADMDWGRKDKKVEMDSHHVQQQPRVTITANSSEVENVKQSNETSTKDEEEENLDDFFASLE